MKDEWVRYLTSIGVTELFQARAEAVVSFYEALYPNQLREIFVTEYVDKENKRQFENFWIFTDTLCLEAKKFLTQDDFDASPLVGQVKYWSVKKEKYDFLEASVDSRLTVYFSLVAGIVGELKASGSNCDHLKRLFLSYVVSNTVKRLQIGPVADDPMEG